jgi:hypothetical protein
MMQERRNGNSFHSSNMKSRKTLFQTYASQQGTLLPSFLKGLKDREQEMQQMKIEMMQALQTSTL